MLKSQKFPCRHSAYLTKRLRNYIYSWILGSWGLKLTWFDYSIHPSLCSAPMIFIDSYTAASTSTSMRFPASTSKNLNKIKEPPTMAPSTIVLKDGHKWWYLQQSPLHLALQMIAPPTTMPPWMVFLWWHLYDVAVNFGTSDYGTSENGTTTDGASYDCTPNDGNFNMALQKRAFWSHNLKKWAAQLCRCR